jgi:hypothetical protein
MPYRKQVEAQSEGEAAFSYYECVDDHDDCPVCGENVGVSGWTGEYRYKRCYPEKRVVIKGFWWWRKKCPS